MGSENDYEILEEIGKGTYGKVYRAARKDGQIFAIKIIDLDQDDDMDDVMQEISTLQACKCPKLTKYYGSFMNGSSLWVVMELLEGGSLQDLMHLTNSTFNENTIAWIMKEMLIGLNYLHTERKIHRDIKAANVLVSIDGSLRLADFGVSVQLTNSVDKRCTFIGSPYWMAPEVITSSNYDETADIWSLGITAIELATGYPPLSKIHPMKAVMMIPKNPAPNLPQDFETSKKFQSFLEKCLMKNHEQRSNTAELLKHPFIKGAKQTNQIFELLETKRAMKLMEGMFEQDKFESSSIRSSEGTLENKGNDFDCNDSKDETILPSTNSDHLHKTRIPNRGTSWVFDTMKTGAILKSKSDSECGEESPKCKEVGERDLIAHSVPLKTPKHNENEIEFIEKNSTQERLSISSQPQASSAFKIFRKSANSSPEKTNKGSFSSIIHRSPTSKKNGMTVKRKSFLFSFRKSRTKDEAIFDSKNTSSTAKSSNSRKPKLFRSFNIEKILHRHVEVVNSKNEKEIKLPVELPKAFNEVEKENPYFPVEGSRIRWRKKN